MVTTGTEENTRVLVLTSDAGYGHQSAARAIRDALDERYGAQVTIDIVNPLNDPRTPTWLRESQYLYDDLIRKIPELYKLSYDTLDQPLPKLVMDNILTVLLYKTMQHLVEQYEPDIVVATYPLYHMAATTVREVHGLDFPTIVVVTDLATVHREWFYAGIDHCVVPTDIVADLAIEAGIPKERISIVGIPVDPALSKPKADKALLRQQLGWSPDKRTVLAVGSPRATSMVEKLDILNHAGFDLQVVAVAGGDDDLHRELQAVEWHVPAHIYNFVDNLPEMMQAADWIICKAGGLIVTEALAAGLPLMLSDAIAGQETGNAELVVKHGAGCLVEDRISLLEATCHWLEHEGQGLEERRRQALKMGRPDAAYVVADLIVEQAKNGKQPITEENTLLLTSLIDAAESWYLHPANLAHQYRLTALRLEKYALSREPGAKPRFALRWPPRIPLKTDVSSQEPSGDGHG